MDSPAVAYLADAQLSCWRHSKSLSAGQLGHREPNKSHRANYTLVNPELYQTVHAPRQTRGIRIMQPNYSAAGGELFSGQWTVTQVLVLPRCTVSFSTYIYSKNSTTVAASLPRPGVSRLLSLWRTKPRVGDASTHAQSVPG